MRLDGPQSLHSSAVQNQIDVSPLLDKLRDGCSSCTLTFCKALPQYFIIFLSRVLCTHIPFFKLSFDGVIDWHIEHKYYQYMCTKSVVVSLEWKCVITLRCDQFLVILKREYVG